MVALHDECNVIFFVAILHHLRAGVVVCLNSLSISARRLRIFSAFSASTTPIFCCHSRLRCLAARNICTNCSCSVHSSAVKVLVVSIILSFAFCCKDTTFSRTPHTFFQKKCNGAQKKAQSPRHSAPSYSVVKSGALPLLLYITAPWLSYRYDR